MSPPSPPSPPSLVLASSSKARAELLSRLELPFIQATPNFDERRHDALFATLSPQDFALMLAQGKARSLTEKHPNAWILAADQIAVPEGGDRQLLHKPESPGAALDQLMSMAGKTHQLVTGIVLLRSDSEVIETAVDIQHLRMRNFSREQAAQYVNRHRPLECVGSYRIEDPGIKLFEEIRGEDHTGIIGLPLLAVCRIFRSVGLLAP